MITLPLAITNAQAGVDKSFMVSNAWGSGWGFALRPFIDTHIASNGSDPTSGYKFSYPQCPMPPAPGPFLVKVHFADGEVRDIYVFDNRPFYFSKQYKYCDLIVIGWGSEYGQGSNVPPQMSTGISSYVMLDIFEGPNDSTAVPSLVIGQTFPLFYMATAATVKLPNEASSSTPNSPFPYYPLVKPVPVNPLNFFGLNDECAIIATKVVAGAFYVFPQMSRWQITLQTTGSNGPIAINIWTSPAGSPWSAQQFNEQVPTGSWAQLGSGKYQLVLARETAFLDQWIQLSVAYDAGNPEIDIVSAYAEASF